MSDKSIFDAIMARDLSKVSEMIHQSSDPRGPTRKIVSVECRTDITLVSLECGHISDCAQHFTYKVGAMMHCFNCGPHGVKTGEVHYTNCDICGVNQGHREMNASGVEGVICLECDEKLEKQK